MELLQVLANSILGMLVVFAVLIILMVVVTLMAKLTKKPASAPIPAPAASTPAAEKLAKGSCGEIKLYDVPEKTAAMLMAITADKMNAPLNTLRFISIKEVK